MSVNIPPDDVCNAIERPFRGKLFAYVATYDDAHTGHRLSIVVDGETGHYPQSHHVAYGTDEEIKQIADKLNRERLRLSPPTVTTIIGQSLRSESRGRSRRRRE